MVEGVDDGSFLHIFNLIVAQNRVKARRRRGLLTETHVHVRASCSVENCGACGEDDSGQSRSPTSVAPFNPAGRVSQFLFF